MPTTPVRDRLLLAGAKLLEDSGGEDVSTRAICELAGVQAPTLYHHFGNKQGLLDAVVSHGFRDFLAAQREHGADGGNPVQEIREGWDRHVQFGLEHPMFYAYIYARVGRGTRCGVVSDVEAMLLEALEPAAKQGLLAIAPSDAAAEIMAASSGVIMSLITDPDDEPDLRMSAHVRDAVLDAVTTSERAEDRQEGAASTVASAAVTLASVLDDAPDVLSATETALLRDWLGRLSAR
ncbi:TetR family transcriptional regulator [Streptomyces sp. Ag109_O5-1]|uniref:TetR/AcrR family transcriptional regulator n=1 Tax=Streptomyces sp. Ag109_O5-1 TaxID=1938851 RepID=UPI000F50095E|nr:TetR/AcrR family transcriptional regulator [Streptomyces sp. Ag109_O5-1]RPE40714.1 TetR family transcriptional regulator [Streptomyces sp. Ag109_O5-1]